MRNSLRECGDPILLRPVGMATTIRVVNKGKFMEKGMESSIEKAWKWWDRSMHYLFYVDPQAFLDLLLGEGQVRYIKHLPEKLEGDLSIVDTLLDTVVIENGLPLLVHLESETRKDAKIGERLVEYGLRIHKKYDYERDVLSGVFHLGNDAALEPSPLVWNTPLRQWSRPLEFGYPIVEMQNLTPEDLRRRGRVALLSLLPLTEGGAEPDIVQGMLHDLEFEDRELLRIGFGMAMRRVSDTYRESLKKEYYMIYNELRADPLFREFLVDEREEGRQQGALQTAQETVIRLIAARFPELEDFAKSAVAAVSNVERLQVLVIELSAASSEEIAKQLLFSLASDS
jgi:hypothetical protein